MSTSISKKDLHKAASRFEKIKTRIAGIKKKAERTTEKVIRSAETGGAAFAMGVIQGRTGGVEVVGVPLELGLGIGLNVVGYLGGAGKHSDHLNALGDGCLAAYATTLGRGVGATWKEKAATGGSLADPSTPALSATKTSGVSLTPQEIAMAAQVAARQ